MTVLNSWNLLVNSFFCARCTTRFLSRPRRFLHLPRQQFAWRKIMLKDRYGNSVSTGSHAALKHYNEALELIRLYRGDPITALDAALGEDPEFGAAWAARAGLLVQQTDKAY